MLREQKTSIGTSWRNQQFNPYICLAESRVLERSMAIVTGPTPPGTGVIAEATFTASLKQTSPVRW